MYRWHCAGKLYEDYTSNPMPNPHPSNAETESMDCTGGASNTLSKVVQDSAIQAHHDVCSWRQFESYLCSLCIICLACTLPSLHLGTMGNGTNMSL